MKCPRCNADMTFQQYDANGYPWLGGIMRVLSPSAYEKPRMWASKCPSCGFSGPRQSTKPNHRSSSTMPLTSEQFDQVTADYLATYLRECTVAQVAFSGPRTNATDHVDLRLEIPFPAHVGDAKAQAFEAMAAAIASDDTNKYTVLPEITQYRQLVSELVFGFSVLMDNAFFSEAYGHAAKVPIVESLETFQQRIRTRLTGQESRPMVAMHLGLYHYLYGKDAKIGYLGGEDAYDTPRLTVAAVADRLCGLDAEPPVYVIRARGVEMPWLSVKAEPSGIKLEAGGLSGHDIVCLRHVAKELIPSG